MKMWFAPGSEVPLYRQLETQVVLAIVSGDLNAGDRLPSTRALARRFAIHANTVSAAYQHLEQAGWVESRRGSGVYVKERELPQMSPEQVLDVHIAAFLSSVRELGLPAETVRAQVARWMAAPAPDHLLLIEPDRELALILLTELRQRTMVPVRTVTPKVCRADREGLAGAVCLCRPSSWAAVQEAVGTGIEVRVLPINSALNSLAPLVSATPGHLIAVVSHWPEFLETAKTLLLAAGVPGEALMVLDANAAEELRGLAGADAIVCDQHTASRPELPTQPKRFVFPVLAASVDALLRPIEDAVLRARSV